MTCTREELLVNISKRLNVMKKQEASHYFVPDYLAAEWQQGLRDATAAKPNIKGDASSPNSASSSSHIAEVLDVESLQHQRAEIFHFDARHKKTKAQRPDGRGCYASRRPPPHICGGRAGMRCSLAVQGRRGEPGEMHETYYHFY